MLLAGGIVLVLDRGLTGGVELLGWPYRGAGSDIGLGGRQHLVPRFG